MHLTPSVKVYEGGQLCLPSEIDTGGEMTGGDPSYPPNELQIVSFRCIRGLCTGYGNLLYKYVYAEALGEIREIDYVKDETTIVLKTPFSGGFSGVTFYVIDYRYAYQEVSVVTLKNQAVAIASVGGIPVQLPDLIPCTFRSTEGLMPLAVRMNGTTQITTLI